MKSQARSRWTYLDETQGRDFLLHKTPAERRVGDPYTLEVEVRVRVLIKEVGDIRNVCNTTSIDVSPPTHRQTHRSQHTTDHFAISV